MATKNTRKTKPTVNAAAKTVLSPTAQLVENFINYIKSDEGARDVHTKYGQEVDAVLDGLNDAPTGPEFVTAALMHTLLGKDSDPVGLFAAGVGFGIECARYIAEQNKGTFAAAA